MMNYILQVILFQILFLAIYDFFLSKETFFTKNRWYLLITPIVSFLIPLIKIPTFQKAVSQEYVVQLPEIFLSPETVIKRTFQETTLSNSINYLPILFWAGVAVFLILFLLKLTKIISLIRKNNKLTQHNFTLIFLPNETKAFSFFNFVFLGDAIKDANRQNIIEHELIHSKQKHTWDLLLFEFLKIVMWFNPMVYMYQKRITLVHEYISDAIVAKSETKENYINNLLSNFFQVENIAFINQFYKPTFIKKRIIMMTKKQSNKMNQLKYLMLIPVLLTMLFYTACSEDFQNETELNKSLKNTKIYMPENDGIKTETIEEQSYMDIYFAFDDKPLGIQIKEKDLFPEALNEYEDYKRRVVKAQGEKNLFITKLYFYNDRPVIGLHKNYTPRIKSDYDEKNVMLDEIVVKEEVSFMNIDKAPTYPDCKSGDKDCFSKNIQKHFIQNFNSKLPKTLGLSSGRKRVFIGFNINKEGEVVDIKARAPHPEIEKEVIKVMNSLPKMTPGENEGKKVNVKYSIPFTIIVE